MFSRTQFITQLRLPGLAAFTLALFLILVACKPSQPDSESEEATRPLPTAVPAKTLGVPTATSAAIEESVATGVPVVTEPQINELATFVEQLETAITNQDYVQMQALMADPIAVGAWRSEWRTYDPAQTTEQFQNAALPAPSAVQFTGIDNEDIAKLIGQPAASIFGPETNVVVALHSTGWGQSSSDEAILFVVEEDGRYTWSAFLYTSGSFAESQIGAVSAPIGLIYRVVNGGFYQIQSDGQHHQLLDEQTASIPNLQISPDGRHAAYLDDQRQLWLIDTTTGDQRNLAGDFDLSQFLTWGDSRTLFVGAWLDPNEADGPNLGHIATLNIRSGALQILDEENLSGNRPALLSDYSIVAFVVFAAATSGRLYHPDSGSQTFDPSTFTAANEMIRGPLFNPAWSADGDKIAWLTSTGERFAVQAYELEAKTAVQLHDWDPARFGALVPSPAWSSGGQWLALEIWANGPEGSGVWVLAADGGSQTVVHAQGHEPHWVNDFQLVFNLEGESRLYDVGSGEQFRLDLPANASIVNVTDPADLLTSIDDIGVADTPVAYVLALQDVTMFSGPGEEYEEIGGIFDGQTALVTGQSFDSGWWRVICPDDTVGNCWVTADPAYTLPSNSPDPQTTLPDPATLKMVREMKLASADGRWQAIASQTEPVQVNDSEQFYASLKVTDGATSWTPIAEWRGYGLGYTWPNLYQWSQDGLHLYYTNMVSPDGCAIYTSGSDLYRLDVTNGAIVELLPEGKSGNFSLSPDETTLAYTTYNGLQELFVLRDIASGNEKSVILSETGDNVQTAEIFWSANGKTAVLALVHDACLSTETSSIIRINTKAMIVTALIEKDDRKFLIRDWLTQNRAVVRLVDKDGETWQLDIASGELVQES